MRLEYIRSCDRAQNGYYTNEVRKCQGDQGKLYKLISKLTNGEIMMPYPECESEYDLSEKFSVSLLGRLTRS